MLTLLGASLCAALLSGCGGGHEEPGSRPATGSSASSSAPSNASAPASGTSAATRAAPAAKASASAQSTGSASADASQFRAGAEAICLKRNRELSRTPLDAGSLPATASNASQRIAIERRALSELGALSPPSRKATRWKAVIDQTERVLAVEVKLATAARAGDGDGVTRQIELSENPQFRLFAAATNADVGRCEVVG